MFKNARVCQGGVRCDWKGARVCQGDIRLDWKGARVCQDGVVEHECEDGV